MKLPRDATILSAFILLLTACNQTELPVQEPHMLRVNVQGNGLVTSSPVGLSCSDDCTVPFSENTTITLTASPATGYVFVSWGGNCSGTSCSLSMTANHAVTATFEPVSFTPTPEPEPTPEPSLAPKVSEISPNPVVGTDELQWLSIIGSHFETGAVVTLRAQSDDTKLVVPPERTEVLEQSEINIQVNVTPRADTWIIEVTNPDGQTSEPMSFEVIAPASAYERWKIEPDTLTFRSIDGVVPDAQTFTLTNTGDDASSFYIEAGDADHYIPALYFDLVTIPTPRGTLAAGESTAVTVTAEKCWGWGEAYTAHTTLTLEGNETATLEVIQECLLAPLPANDNFANATELAGTRGERYGTNAGATTEPGEPDIGLSDDFFESYGWTTWYSWKAPASGLASFEFEEIKDLLFDYDWRIYEGTALPNLKEVTAAPRYEYPRVTKAFPVVAGKTYHLRVGGAYFDAEGYYFGEFMLRWEMR